MDLIQRFIDETLPTLQRAEIGTWLVLWRLAEEDGTVRDVPQWQIAHRVGCDGRTVQRAVRALKKAGLLKTRKGRTCETSEYRVMGGRDTHAVDGTGEVNKC